MKLYCPRLPYCSDSIQCCIYIYNYNYVWSVIIVFMRLHLYPLQFGVIESILYSEEPGHISVLFSAISVFPCWNRKWDQYI